MMNSNSASRWTHRGRRRRSQNLRIRFARHTRARGYRFERAPTSRTARRRACPHRGNDVRPAIPGCLRAAVALAALALVATGDALAAEAGPPLRIGHYSSGSGLIGFVLDRLGTPIKLRFDDSDEILALTPERAPYDSMTLKRDDGIGVLRIYENGQVLLFDEKLKIGRAHV